MLAARNAVTPSQVLDPFDSPKPMQDKALRPTPRSTTHYNVTSATFLRKATRELRADVHASSYVHPAAALEQLVGNMLTAVVNEINVCVGTLADLRLSLFAMAQAGPLDSLQDVRGLKMWGRRTEVFGKIASSDTCLLNPAQLPLDGRSIRPEHLDTIWQVLGLGGDPFPGPIHRLALNSLANNRNAVAHGEEKPSTVADRSSIPDTLMLLDRIEQVVIHMWEATTAYLSAATYRR